MPRIRRQTDSRDGAGGTAETLLAATWILEVKWLNDNETLTIVSSAREGRLEMLDQWM